MADIYLSINNPADEPSFRSSHWVHTPVAYDRHLVNLTGIVIIDYKGITSGQWRRDRLHLAVPFPRDFFPANEWFKLENWAPFVTINAIYNQDEAVNAGWAVDDFGIDPQPGMKLYNSLGIWADIAVRDQDGYLYRVGYNVSVTGVITDPPPGPK